MKTPALIITLTIALHSFSAAQNIGINATGAAPHSSAILDVSSSSQGVLVPRVALTATNSASPVTSPATSLLVYNTATAGTGVNAVAPGFYFWNGSGWSRIGDGWTLTGNYGTDASVHYLGTADANDLVIKTNDTEQIRVSADGSVGIGSSDFDGEKLLVDAGSGTTDPLMAIYAVGNTNSYVEFNIQNRSNGNMASTDIVATANNGTGSSVYVDLGINSQGYSHNASNILNGPNLAYLYSNAEDFKIGNGAPGRHLIFFTNRVNGPASTITANGNERMRITAAGNIGMGTSTPVSTLEVAGSVGKAITVTSTDLTLDSNHHTVIISSGSSASITLPAAASTNARRIYVIVNQTNGSRTISSYRNFSNTAVTTIAATSSITLQSDGSVWYRIQ